MNLFNFSQEELLTFFAVLMRYSSLAAVLPFFGDRVVPAVVRILLSFAFTFALFPSLVSHGWINPGHAQVWASTTGLIVGTVILEVLTGLTLGFICRSFFEAINWGASLIGTYMGFASASQYDPNQESQAQVLSSFHYALAMLLFISLDGHHLMLQAALQSYSILGIGELSFGKLFSAEIIRLSTQVFLFGFQMAGPMAIAIFVINIFFGVMAKALPQVNILALSLGISVMIGFAVLWLTTPHISTLMTEHLSLMSDEMRRLLYAMKAGG